MDAGADAPLERRDPTPTDAASAHADTTSVSPPPDGRRRRRATRVIIIVIVIIITVTIAFIVVFAMIAIISAGHDGGDRGMRREFPPLRGRSYPVLGMRRGSRATRQLAPG